MFGNKNRIDMQVFSRYFCLKYADLKKNIIENANATRYVYISTKPYYIINKN